MEMTFNFSPSIGIFFLPLKTNRFKRLNFLKIRFTQTYRDRSSDWFKKKKIILILKKITSLFSCTIKEEKQLIFLYYICIYRKIKKKLF